MFHSHSLAEHDIRASLPYDAWTWNIVLMAIIGTSFSRLQYLELWLKTLRTSSMRYLLWDPNTQPARSSLLNGECDSDRRSAVLTYHGPKQQ